MATSFILARLKACYKKKTQFIRLQSWNTTHSLQNGLLNKWISLGFTHPFGGSPMTTRFCAKSLGSKFPKGRKNRSSQNYPSKSTGAASRLEFAFRNCKFRDWSRSAFLKQDCRSDLKVQEALLFNRTEMTKEQKLFKEKKIEQQICDPHRLRFRCFWRLP